MRRHGLYMAGCNLHGRIFEPRFSFMKLLSHDFERYNAYTARSMRQSCYRWSCRHGLSDLLVELAVGQVESLGGV